jgi:hypothetical protein
MIAHAPRKRGVRRLGQELADAASPLVGWSLRHGRWRLYRLANRMLDVGLSLEYPQRRRWKMKLAWKRSTMWMAGAIASAYGAYQLPEVQNFLHPALAAHPHLASGIAAAFAIYALMHVPRHEVSAK